MMKDLGVFNPNEIPTKDGPVTVDGRLIGMADSSRTHHNHDGAHVPNEPDGRRGKCSTCRWTEVRIFATDAGYIVVTIGQTTMPDETVFTHIRRLESPYEVIEVLTVRKPGAVPYLSKSAARALAQAANEDSALENAYLDRAVV